jgi:hypothetical protein
MAAARAAAGSSEAIELGILTQGKGEAAHGDFLGIRCTVYTSKEAFGPFATLEPHSVPTAVFLEQCELFFALPYLTGELSVHVGVTPPPRSREGSLHATCTFPPPVAHLGQLSVQRKCCRVAATGCCLSFLQANQSTKRKEGTVHHLHLTTPGCPPLRTPVFLNCVWFLVYLCYRRPQRARWCT